MSHSSAKAQAGFLVSMGFGANSGDVAGLERMALYGDASRAYDALSAAGVYSDLPAGIMSMCFAAESVSSADIYTTR